MADQTPTTPTGNDIVLAAIKRFFDMQHPWVYFTNVPDGDPYFSNGYVGENSKGSASHLILSQ